MTIENALYTRLTTHAGTTALIVKRCYPKRAPQGATLPCLVYERIGAQRVTALAADTDLVYARFQVTVIADTYDEILSIATQVRLALQRYKATVGGVVINNIDMDYGETDIYDPAVEFYQRAMDFEIAHRE